MAFAFIVWILAALFGLWAPVMAWSRRGPRAALASLLAPIGSFMSLALLSAVVGLLENHWNTRVLSFWAVASVGVVGLVLAFVGWRVALRPRIPVGACRRCGHPLLAGAERCSECGHDA